MRIAIVEEAGTLGRRVAAKVEARGHKVRALSHGPTVYPVDLITGADLRAALVGCDGVTDAVDQASRKHSMSTFVSGPRRLFDAAEAAGVEHHACVSIVGCDRVPLAYFRAQAERERIVEGRLGAVDDRARNAVPRVYRLRAGRGEPYATSAGAAWSGPVQRMRRRGAGGRRGDRRLAAKSGYQVPVGPGFWERP